MISPAHSFRPGSISAYLFTPSPSHLHRLASAANGYMALDVHHVPSVVGVYAVYRAIVPSGSRLDYQRAHTLAAHGVSKG